jgi:hypothetical protein
MPSHRPAGGPRGSGDGERPFTQTFAGYRFKTCATIVIEALDVVTGRTYAVCVRLPPLLEGRMHDVDRNGIFFHVAQARTFEYLSEVPHMRPGE